MRTHNWLPWMPLFVVVLALSLSIIDSQLEPRPSKPTGSNEKTDLIKHPADQHQTNANSPSNIGTPQQQAGSSHDNGQDNDNTLWLIMFSGIAAIATAAIAKFNYQLVGVTRDMVKASKLAAEVAELALNAERPFVFAESLKWTTRARPLEYPHLQMGKLEFEGQYDLRNRGKGVAIIDGIKGRFHLARTIWGEPIDAERAQMKTLRLTVRERVIGPGEHPVNFIFGLYLQPSTWTKIRFGQTELILVGFIRYHDTFERWSYRQDFCFRYRVGSFDAQTGVVETDFFFSGPDKHNRYHKRQNTGLPKPE